MDYTIRNDTLQVVISDKGCELQSIKAIGLGEVLWQGSNQNWSEHAPNLFPYIGRLTNKSYLLNGKTYSMEIHGFLKNSVLEATQISECSIIFTLKSNCATMASYPFEFDYSLEYTLKHSTLEMTYHVNNRSNQTMYFGIGGHPGFNIPWQNDLKFEDYYIEFQNNVTPRRINLSPSCFVAGGSTPFMLDKNRLHLQQALFDNDAIVLAEMGKRVVLGSDKCKQKITVEFDSMNYLGIWNWPTQNVNYVCIEPWTSLPSRQDIVEDLAQQENLIALGKGEHYSNLWSITID